MRIEETLRDYKQGRVSSILAHERILEQCWDIFQAVSRRYQNQFQVPAIEAQHDVSTALWKTAMAWKPGKHRFGPKSWVKAVLWRRSIDEWRSLHGDQRSFKSQCRRATISLDDPDFEAPVVYGPEPRGLDFDELAQSMRLVGIQKDLLQAFVDRGCYRSALADVRSWNPELPKKKIRVSAEVLRSKLRELVSSQYPFLIDEGHERRRITMATKKKATGKKANGQAGKAKTSTSTKKRQAKNKSSATKEAQKNTQAEEEEEAKPLPEKDVKAYVRQINDLVKKNDQTKLNTTWDIGKKLQDLKDAGCTPDQFKAITTERILGPDGQPKKRAWLYKAMKMANTLSRARANKIGMNRLDSILRIKDPEDRKKLVTQGAEITDEDGETVETKAVEKMTCAELKAWVNEYLARKYPSAPMVPQEQVMKAVKKLETQIAKFMDECGAYIRGKYRYSAEQIDVLYGFFDQLVDVQDLLNKSKPTKEAQEVLQQLEETEEVPQLPSSEEEAGEEATA